MLGQMTKNHDSLPHPYYIYIYSDEEAKVVQGGTLVE